HPFKTKPIANAPVHWVKPELVCEVNFDSWTDDGQMRHPVFVGLREDKPATSVTRENKATDSDSQSSRAASENPGKENSPQSDRPTSRQLLLNGVTVHLTNLTKIYWPDDGYTKGDLINYYREVTSIILPHLVDRPESLHRHPGGILEKSFFQKDIRPQK